MILFKQHKAVDEYKYYAQPSKALNGENRTPNGLVDRQMSYDKYLENEDLQKQIEEMYK